MQKLTFYSLLPFAACVIIDAALYFSGYSYRFFFYESALCLILFQNRFANAMLFGAVLLLKVLFVFFSINIFSLWWLTLEAVFIYATIVSFSVSVFFFSNKRSLLYFLVVLVSTVIFDKQSFRDQFASSILYTSYHAAVVSPSIPIESEVHEILRESLLNGPTIFINWESLGVPRDPQIVEKLLQRNPKLNYKVINTLPRATISSEFEYLCGHTFGKLDEQVICLPSDQTSIALHGNFGFFLNRENTYNSFGFQSAKLMHSIAGSVCFFSFRGKCDSAVFESVIKLARSKSAEFIYALTLDSHFPYAKYSSHAEQLWQEIDDFLVVFKSEDLSFNLIIVGDHPPPLAPEFFDDQVPLFYLKN